MLFAGLNIVNKYVMQIVIIGNGGHSKVVADILSCMGHSIYGYYDDNGSADLGKISDFIYDPSLKYICAIGDIFARKTIVSKLAIPTDSWITAIHPSAIISNAASIGVGSVICAGAIIQAGSIVGDHVIINTNASVDHDCVIADFCHIAPGSTLCGNVRIGETTFIGARGTVVNNIDIGEASLIGAGSLVIKNIPPHVKAYGSPCKIISYII